MPDLEGWMYKLAKAALGSESNHVFVMREVLTEVYMRGFEDGRMAERHDRFTVDQVERLRKEHAERAAEKEETQ